MDELVWLDNATQVLEHGYSGAATPNSTAVLSTTSTASAKRSLSLETTASVVLIITGIGSCANAVVLTVLIRARRQFGGSAHILIANQSAMDLFANVSAMITSIVIFTHGYRYGGDRILDGAICMFFEERRRQLGCRRRSLFHCVYRQFHDL